MEIPRDGQGRPMQWALSTDPGYTSPPKDKKPKPGDIVRIKYGTKQGITGQIVGREIHPLHGNDVFRVSDAISGREHFVQPDWVETISSSDMFSDMDSDTLAQMMDEGIIGGKGEGVSFDLDEGEDLAGETIEGDTVTSEFGESGMSEEFFKNLSKQAFQAGVDPSPEFQRQMRDQMEGGITEEDWVPVESEEWTIDPYKGVPYKSRFQRKPEMY